jgi:hypothetical protein
VTQRVECTGRWRAHFLAAFGSVGSVVGVSLRSDLSLRRFSRKPVAFGLANFHTLGVSGCESDLPSQQRSAAVPLVVRAAYSIEQVFPFRIP